MSASLAGRRALVTGGAGGIGTACAARLRADGATVALLDREPSVAEAAAHLGAVGIRADVAEEAAMRTAVSEAGSRLGGPVDLLVTAAGVYPVTPLVDIEAAEWDAVLAVNLRGPFLAAREVARGLIADGLTGAVVHVASIGGLRADAREPSAHYGAAKAGLVNLTRQMAAEWAPHGIRVNAVCPGLVDTPMLRITDDPERAERYVAERIPLARIGRPEEVAAAVCFLASDDAGYVTGAALPVDGGITAV